MRTVMLDTNCLIYLENGSEPEASYLRQILGAWSRGDLEVVVGAIVASENARPDEEEPSWEAFEALRERAGLASARVLPPVGTWGVTYWDEALWAGEETEELEERIQAVIAPGMTMTDESHDRKWLNVKCDVLTVWTHVWHKTDVLVTNDKRLYNKADALADLGANVQPLASFAASLGDGAKGS